MSTYTQIFYHITFSTKKRKRCFVVEKRKELFRYVWGIIKNKKSYLYRINAVDDHLHILASLHSTVSLADFIKAIKTGSSKWIKEKSVFPSFTYWQDGYGAFSIGESQVRAVADYICGQKERHQTLTFEDELVALAERYRVVFDPRYLWT